MPLSTEDLQNPIYLDKTIWRLLARGAVDSKHPFKLFGISTVNTKGLPDARTVVLRTCEIAEKELCFHTDIRSRKIAHIRMQPEVCLLFWHPKQSLQLRIFGKAEVFHLDEIATKKIATLPPQQLALYGFAASPGSVLQDDKPAVFDEALVSQNFAWVRVSVRTIDVLHLGRGGEHTRAQLIYFDGRMHVASYLQP